MKIRIEVRRQGIHVGHNALNISDEDFEKVSPDTRHWICQRINRFLLQEFGTIPFDYDSQQISVTDIITLNHKIHGEKQ